jgi:micrococcal nuclease
MFTASYRQYLILVLILIVSCGNSKEPDTYRVLKVIDGDTVIIDHPKVERVRYLGIDTPETLKPDSPGDPFSNESTAFNERLVLGKNVTLEIDKEKYDPYGRLLAYVFIDGKLVNEELVREGLARAFFIGPNRKYESRIYKAQEEAQNNKKGIWGRPESFKTPRDNKKFLIKPFHAREYVNDRVVVRGKINTMKKNNSKVMVLSLENDLDIVFFKDSLENFRFFKIDPAYDYIGKPVEVIGRVTMHRGSPQIIVSHPSVIRELN